MWNRFFLRILVLEHSFEEFVTQINTISRQLWNNRDKCAIIISILRVLEIVFDRGRNDSSGKG